MNASLNESINNFFFFIQEAGRRYGFLPRMKRMEITHQFLWYLTYGYSTTDTSTPSGSAQHPGSDGETHAQQAHMPVLSPAAQVKVRLLLDYYKRLF